MGVGGEGSPLNGGAETPTSTTSTGAYTPARTSAPATPTSDYYASMARPGQDNTAALLNSIYQQSLGRAPDAEGAQFWSNAAKQGGWNAQQLAANIQSAGAPERARTGYSSTLNPSTFGDQRVGPATVPSYYNTNPVGVDYANIFNPAARSVTTNQQTLTPGQQAQYLGDWTRHYSQSNRAATEAANAERVKTANTQWANYLNNKAKAEAAATSKGVVDKAVEDALAQQAAANTNSNSVSYFGGKAGGQIGIRGIK